MLKKQSLAVLCLAMLFPLFASASIEPFLAVLRDLSKSDPVLAKLVSAYEESLEDIRQLESDKLLKCEKKTRKQAKKAMEATSNFLYSLSKEIEEEILSYLLQNLSDCDSYCVDSSSIFGFDLERARRMEELLRHMGIATRCATDLILATHLWNWNRKLLGEDFISQIESLEDLNVCVSCIGQFGGFREILRNLETRYDIYSFAQLDEIFGNEIRVANDVAASRVQVLRRKMRVLQAFLSALAGHGIDNFADIAVLVSEFENSRERANRIYAQMSALRDTLKKLFIDLAAIAFWITPQHIFATKHIT